MTGTGDKSPGRTLIQLYKKAKTRIREYRWSLVKKLYIHSKNGWRSDSKLEFKESPRSQGPGVVIMLLNEGWYPFSMFRCRMSQKFRCHWCWRTSNVKWITSGLNETISGFSTICSASYHVESGISISPNFPITHFCLVKEMVFYARSLYILQSSNTAVGTGALYLNPQSAHLPKRFCTSPRKPKFPLSHGS